MSITIRPFVPADLTPLVALWNHCLRADPISPERFWRLFLLDPNFDAAGAIVAADAAMGAPVGFLQALCRRYPLGAQGLQPEQGWLTAFFVAPERRRQGVGSWLLDAGLDHLRRQNRTQVSCNGYAPYYLFPGVADEYADARAFLEARDFAPGADAVAMGMDLVGVETPDAVRRREAALVAEGIAVRLFRRDDTLPLLAFVDGHFPFWAQSVSDGLRAGNETIFIATQESEQGEQAAIIACAQWQNPHNDPPAGSPGRFGPFGVHPDLRNRGVGAVLFYRLIEHVRADGARHLWFGWAGGRNLSFYERAGCKVTRRYQLYNRNL